MALTASELLQLSFQTDALLETNVGDVGTLQASQVETYYTNIKDMCHREELLFPKRHLLVFTNL